MKTLNRILAALFGMAIAGIGFLMVVEAGAALFGQPPALVPYDRWVESLQPYLWSSAESLWVGAGLLIAGAIVIVLQLIRRKPATLSTGFSAAGTEVAVDRSALESSLARAATTVNGVQRAKIRARTRRLRTTVDVAGGEDKETVDAATAILRQRLEDLRIMPVPELAVTSRSRGRAR